MSRNLRLYLSDILTSVGKIERYTAGMSYDRSSRKFAFFSLILCFDLVTAKNQLKQLYLTVRV